MKDDDVNLGREEAKEGNVCRQADGDTEGRDLDLFKVGKIMLIGTVCMQFDGKGLLPHNC